MSIAANLGRLAACNQFFVYRLSEWSATENKWKRKQPWSLKYDNNIKPQMSYNWMSYDAALAAVMRQPVTPGVTWCVGMWITESLGVFFLDIDKLPADYTTTPEANALLARFPGCMVEWSSSRRGVHVIGSRTADIDHCNESPPLELYTDERGIALGLTASGSADTDATEAFATLVTERFPPKPRVATGPVMPPIPGAPADLSAVSLVLRQADRITRAPQGERNAALNGAAFVVGGMVGAGRISRDEARAALVSAVERAGWGDMDVQCGKIDQALDAGAQEPIARAVPVVPGVPVVTTPGVPAIADAPAVETDWTDIVDRAITMINNVGSYKELMSVVLPAIQELRIDSDYSERVVKALGKRLDLFDAKPSVAKLRQMVSPAPRAELADTAPPEWFAPFCYVRRTESYYNTLTCTEFSADNFRTEYTRFMPLKPNGTREDPVQWARERWNVVTVDDTMYRPDRGVYFDFSGRQYANSFNPASLPALAAPSPACHIAIQAFQDHLRLLCSGREWLFEKLLQWIAFNVQNPGRKIRWMPLIKGVGGDGKSIVGELIFETLGEQNVKLTSISNLANSGGFTDWAMGKCVNVIEEIRLEGRERKKIYNAMKNFIGDTRADINRKGKASSESSTNITNHWANSNYGDAMPLDEDDRRICVVFTPYDNIDEAVAAKGLPDRSSLVKHFKMLGASMRSEPGAWRAWLMSVDTSSFDPDDRAPDTPERQSMILMSSDSMDQAVIDAIERGGPGINRRVFSSSRLMGMMSFGPEGQPNSRGWNALLSRLGYRQMSKTIWWDGSAHRIWARKEISADEIRSILNETK